MKASAIKIAMLSLALIAGTAMGRAQTVTVGPHGTYATPCQAFPNLTNGETVQIDANGGVPYNDNVDCTISADNLTIVGVNGRAVMDGTGFYTSKGLWIMNGHDNVVDNIEFRNASGAQNAAGIRIQVADGSETSGTTDGGNITVQHSYVHNMNGTGILGANANQYGSGLNWYSSSPYITFQYDEFAYNGNADQQGDTHNMYMGYGGNMDFTLQYSWTHDSYVGHTIKTRAPYNNILYDLDTDASGTGSYLLDFCLGGSNYVVGDVLYKGPVTNSNTNQNWFIYADYSEDDDGPEYGTANQDLHFINNTVIDDPSNTFPSQYISMSCPNSTQSSCPAPVSGSPAESVAAVIENNIFIGPSGNNVTNQSSAYLKNNLVQTYSTSQLAADFVDWAHYDFHLASGSPAIGAGIYPPTNNVGATDSKALAKYEPVMPTGAVARPTPSGSTMDDGAYSYPRVGTVPSLSLSYTTTVTAPGTGTITVSGLPTPPSGSYNYAAFVSENTSAIPNPPSADSTTGSVTTTFSVNPAVTTSTVVPVDIYAMGGHAVASITVNPGPPTLSSITQDYSYQPFTTVHLEGPAPAGGTVINLSSSNSTYLYVPSSVTVPQGQISAETGSATGSLWGQSPSAPTETITATQGSVVKTVSFAVFTPAFHGTGTEYTSVTGGSPLAWCVVMVGDWPKSGGSIQVTSSNTAVIPNQTITSGYANCNGTLQGSTTPFNDNNFDGDIAIATNSVSTATNVNVTLTLNGDNTNGSGVPNTTTITVNPGVGVPSAPSGLTATAISSSQINLSWTASPTSGVTYTVYRSTTSGFSPGSGNQIASGVTGTTYSDTGLPSSTTYYYLVEAVNGGGNSSPTNQASATTSSSGGTGTDVVAINAGGSASGSYAGDEDYSGGSTASYSGSISTTGVVNPAPQAVYQTERWGASTYTIPGLTSGATYTVRLHFSENTHNAAGVRQFNVAINGTTVLSNFDIFAAAGGEYKAIAEDFTAVANSSGQIVIAFTNGTTSDPNPSIKAIEIQPANDVVAINTGGSAASPYVADEDYSGGSTASYSGSITTTGVVNPAPQAVYQTERWGASTYTIPGLTANGTYTVRLHFSENTHNAAGVRQFNVAINGTTVLSNFDIFAAAGGEYKAIAEDFTAVANSSGQIVIAFTNGTTSDPNASIKGIEIQSTSVPTGPMISSITQDSAYGPGTTVHLSGPAPTGGAVVTLSSSNTSVLWTPSSVLVPVGQTSAETGTQLGSWWGQSPSSKTAVLTGTYNGTKTLTVNVPTSQIHGFGCDYTPCSVKGGNGLEVSFQGAFSGAPEGGGSIQVTSSNTAVIPNQSYSMSAGQTSADWYITTNAVSSTTSVTVNITYNGETYWSPLSVSVTH